MNPDEINAARLQDARDDSDPGPDSRCLRHVQPDSDCEACADAEDAEREQATGDPSSWRDRYDTREEWEGER